MLSVWLGCAELRLLCWPPILWPDRSEESEEGGVLLAVVGLKCAYAARACTYFPAVRTDAVDMLVLA